MEKKIVKTGIELIAEERQRQIEVKKFDVINDEGYKDGELLFAAEAYLMRPFIPKEAAELLWPWDTKYWKPTPENRIRELVKAAALIASEIDRLNSTIEHEIIKQ